LGLSKNQTVLKSGGLSDLSPGDGIFLQSLVLCRFSIVSIPVEYYAVRWRNFADNDVTARSIPIKPSFVDASTIRNNNCASRYVLDTVKEGLSKNQQVDLALSYRMMKDRFLTEQKVASVEI
jgi:hypothetical protein